jgi:hypothetical protein
MPRAKKAAAASPPLKAQGAPGKKRTPSGAFDAAAGKDIYEPESIKAMRLAKGVSQYLVKWVGYDAKDNTWEPIENLAACEDMISDFKEREKTRMQQLEAVAENTRIEKQTAAAEAAAKAAEVAATARVAARAAAIARGTDPAAAAVAVDASAANTGLAGLVTNSGSGGRRTSWAWACFDQTGCAPGKAACKLMKDDGEVCGDLIGCTGGPTSLKTHIMYKHPDEFVKLAPPTEELNLVIDPQSKMNALPSKHRDAIHKAIARWLVKRKRPLSLPEDKEFHDVFNVAMRGAYTPPDHKQVHTAVLLLSGEGKKKLFDINTRLRAEGIKPAVAGDIWSSRGVSLFGMVSSK